MSSLIQEYLNRHNIDDYPIVQRPTKNNNFTLLFKSKKNNIKSKLILLRITAEFPPHAPVCYKLDWYESVHNSNAFNQVSPCITTQWDEYESDLLAMAENFDDMTSITDSQSLDLYIFEIFLYCNDELISTYPLSTQRQFWEIIDESKDLDVRLKKLNECIEQIHKNKSLLTKWMQVSIHIKNSYAFWLGNLFNKKLA